MNKVILSGRLTSDPEMRYTAADNPVAITRYTLAVDRRYKHNGEQSTDFVRVVAFGKSAEFADKYFMKGKKIMLTGRLQIESYTTKNGQRAINVEVVAEEQEFADSKRKEDVNPTGGTKPADDDFLKIPDGMDQEELPFN